MPEKKSLAIKAEKRWISQIRGNIGSLCNLLYVLYIIALGFFQELHSFASNPDPTGTGGALADSKLVIGTKRLINDASMTGMILAPFIAVGMIVYFFIRKGAADEMDQKKWTSRIWVTLFCLVGVELAGVIIGLVTKYYT